MREAILRTLQSRRFPLSSERAAQDAIEAAFEADGVPFEREKPLGGHGRPDFYLAGIVVEVKVAGSGGSKREIFRQCLRYADHPDVVEVILASNVSLGMPDIGKPFTFVSLGRAWL